MADKLTGAKRREFPALFAARARTVLLAKAFTLRVITPQSEASFTIKRAELRELFARFTNNLDSLGKIVAEAKGGAPLPTTKHSPALALLVHHLVVAAADRGFTISVENAVVTMDLCNSAEPLITGFESEFTLPPLGRINVWAR